MRRSILLIISVLTLYFLLCGCDSGRETTPQNSEFDQEKSVGELLLRSNSDDEVMHIVEIKNLQFEKEGSTFYIFDIDLFEMQFNCVAEEDLEGKIRKVECYRILNGSFNKSKGEYVYKQVNAYEMKEITAQLVRSFTELFGVVDSNHKYVLFDYSGNSLDNQSDESFERVLEGSAYIELTIRDSKQSFWKMTIQKKSETGIECWVSHFIGTSEYDNVYGNINLSK